MNVTCAKCGKKYVIADDKVAGKTSVKIRCKQCQNLIAVAVGPGAAGPSSLVSPPTAVPTTTSAGFQVRREPTTAGGGAVAPAPGAEGAPGWFAMVGGKQEGPFDLRTLQARVGQGEVTLRTYVWKAGMSDWKRAADVPDVSPIFAGLSAGATATGRTQSSTRSSPSGVIRDVAVANETPSPEFTRREPGAEAGREAQDPVAALAAQRQDEPTAPQPAPGGAGEAPVGTEAPHDPFAQLAPLKEGEGPPPGENTKFFIARAGVNKRNPPWKIALFAAALLGVPVGITYLLSSFHVVELPTVTRTTEDGREVQETFFSPGGMSGLRDLLTGEAQQKKEAAERARRAKETSAAATARAQQAEAAPEVVAPPPRPSNPALAALYGSDELKTRGPRVRKDDGEAAGGPQVNAAGLSQDAAMKVVAEKSKAFQQCVEAALHRNPNLAVGNILVVLTVGASGAVKSASVEPRKHEGADWAQCMVTTARRIVFPASDGETQLELPFKVGVAIGP